MFDMSWGEIMVIGGVALIVIGPKDLPKALRTVGQMTSKVRRLAGEFQSQFSEAMREAELEDVRREVEGLNRSVTSAASTAFNPIQTIRDEIKGAAEFRDSGSASSAASSPPLGDLDAAGTLPAQAGEIRHPAEPPDGPRAGGWVSDTLPASPAPTSAPAQEARGLSPFPEPEPVAFPETQSLVPLPVDEPVLPAAAPAPPERQDEAARRVTS